MPLSCVDRFLSRLNYGLFPPVCRLCGESGQSRIDLCRCCQAEFPSRPEPLAVASGSVLAGFTYAEPVAALVRRFKFHDDLAAGRLLARLAAEAFIGSTPEALIPVPLHASRLRQRGFNQALELARYWGRCRGIPVSPQLIRIRATRIQSGLPAGERLTNVTGAFRVSGEVPAHVALVDDVVTTGSTTAEAARALRLAGAGRVDVWCLARAVKVDLHTGHSNFSNMPSQKLENRCIIRDVVQSTLVC